MITGSKIQGVDTRICTILTAATGLGDNACCGTGHGSPYCSMYYRKVTKSLRIFAQVTKSLWNFAKVTGSQRFSSAVTLSQLNFRKSQIVTTVTAVSTAHVGVS